MLALYGSGRQAEALASYRDARRALDEQLGIQPSPELRRLEQRILEQDPALAAPASRDPIRATVGSRPAGRTRYASSGDVSLAFQVFGDGDLELALITGWVLPMEVFRDDPAFARFLDRLGAFARVLMWDKRGTGLSDRIAPGARPTLDERTGDLAAVMDAAGFQRPAILGLSEGCHLAARFAVLQPERASMLGLYGGWARTMRAPDHPHGASRAQHLRLIALTQEHWGDAAQLLRYWAPSAQDDEQLRAWWGRALRLGATPTAAAMWLELMADVDLRAALPAIRVPTLVVHRRGDVIVPVGNGRPSPSTSRMPSTSSFPEPITSGGSGTRMRSWTRSNGSSCAPDGDLRCRAA
jgi:pimeloyl-ACP methyl ester carboxylesterase